MGFRFLDPALGGSNDHGNAIVIHGGLLGKEDKDGHILLRDNVIFDSVNGVAIADQRHVSFVGNLIADIKRLEHDGNTYPYENSKHLIVTANNTEVYGNILVTGDHLWMHSHTAIDWDFSNNVIIDVASYYFSEEDGDSVTADYNNYFAAAQWAKPGDHDITSADPAAAGHFTRTITRKRITGPEQVEIPYGTPGPESPLVTNKSPDLGSRPGMGVDDALW